MLDILLVGKSTKYCINLMNEINNNHMLKLLE